MKQREPGLFGEFIIQFWVALLSLPWLSWFLAVGVGWVLFWVLRQLQRSGFNNAIYNHYLKRINLKQLLTIEPTDSTED